jgi:hypothetical protein
MSPLYLFHADQWKLAKKIGDKKLDLVDAIVIATDDVPVMKS